jgi:type IV pilus assembly protein PilZ
MKNKEDRWKESERRNAKRFETEIEVDIQHDDTFLFSYITNISELGIFIYSKSPKPPGTRLRLRFGPPQVKDYIQLNGEVVWINPYKEGEKNINPGMGVKFIDLTPELRERLIEIVRKIAYLKDKEHS